MTYADLIYIDKDKTEKDRTYIDKLRTAVEGLGPTRELTGNIMELYRVLSGQRGDCRDPFRYRWIDRLQDTQKIIKRMDSAEREKSRKLLEVAKAQIDYLSRKHANRGGKRAKNYRARVDKLFAGVINTLDSPYDETRQEEMYNTPLIPQILRGLKVEGFTWTDLLKLGVVFNRRKYRVATEGERASLGWRGAAKFIVSIYPLSQFSVSGLKHLLNGMETFFSSGGYSSFFNACYNYLSSPNEATGMAIESYNLASQEMKSAILYGLLSLFFIILGTKGITDMAKSYVKAEDVQLAPQPSLSRTSI